MAWKVIKSLIIPKTLDVQSWNLYTMSVLMNALCKPNLGVPRRATKILQAENRQKVNDFEAIYLGNYRFWWKMVCDCWAHHQPPFFWLCSVTPTWILFFFFFLSYFFFLFFSGYLLLNCLTHCILSLSDWRYQGGLLLDWNWGCQVGGIPLKQVLQNFELLNCWS